MTLTLGARIDREEISSEGREGFDPTQQLDSFLAQTKGFRDPRNSLFDPGSPLVDQAARATFTGFEDFVSFERQVVGLLCDEGPTFGPCSTAIRLDLLNESYLQGSLENLRRQDNLEIANTNISPYFSVAWDPLSNGKMALKASAGRHYNNIPLDDSA